MAGLLVVPMAASVAGVVANFDLAVDDQSLVMVKSERERPFLRMNVVLNWSEELRRRQPMP